MIDGASANEHDNVLSDPYRWMQQNKEKTHELNVRNSEKFEHIYIDRLTKFNKY
jgi:hypothetical protein